MVFELNWWRLISMYYISSDFMTSIWSKNALLSSMILKREWFCIFFSDYLKMWINHHFINKSHVFRCGNWELIIWVIIIRTFIQGICKKTLSFTNFLPFPATDWSFINFQKSWIIILFLLILKLLKRSWIHYFKSIKLKA